MEANTKTALTVQSLIDAPVAKVWEYWSTPAHIIKWNTPSPEWHTPKAENDLREGGKFLSRMEARDGSMGFDFGGIYDTVKEHEVIAYTMGDGRKVRVDFTTEGNKTKLVETFDPETINSLEMQQAGWQAILDEFRKYTEAN